MLQPNTTGSEVSIPEQMAIMWLKSSRKQVKCSKVKKIYQSALMEIKNQKDIRIIID